MDKIKIIQHYNLQDNPDIDILEYTEDNWLELRKKGIGGSDVGAIMGSNEYSSPLQVYKDKVEDTKRNTDNMFTRKGKDLEGLIRENYVKPELQKLGFNVYPGEYIFINKQYPWFRANIDAMAVPDFGTYKDNIGIEIKWVSNWGTEKWDTEESMYGIPPSYYDQVQTYMLVLGLNEFIVCAMFDNTWTPKFYRIKRDNTRILQIINTTKQFYELNILMKIPPRYTSAIDKEDIKDVIDTPITEEIKWIKDDSMNEDIARYKNLTKQAKDLQAEADKVKDIIVNKYMENHIPSNSVYKVSVSSYESSRFDSTAFKADYPDTYAKYIKKTSALRVTIK